MPPKRMVFCDAHSTRLSRRASRSCSGAFSFFAVRRAVNVPGNTLSNSWGLPIRRQKMSSMRWNMKRSQVFSKFCAEMLSVDAWHRVDYGRFVWDKDILLLETRFALRAVQYVSERHRNVRVPLLLDNLVLVVLLTKERSRHPSYIRNRIPCQRSFVFRWAPSEVNYSDRGSRFYDADFDPSKCLLIRLRVLQRQSINSHSLHQTPPSSLVSTTPCQYTTTRLVRSIDLGSAAETPVPSCAINHCVSYRSSMWIATLCLRLIATRFSGRFFLGGGESKQLLELWPILFENVDVSEASNCCASSGWYQKFQQPYSCALFPEAYSTHNPVEPAKSDGLNETVGDLGRKGHQNYPRGWKREGIQSSSHKKQQRPLHVLECSITVATH